jgi:hypothetical protein
LLYYEVPAQKYVGAVGHKKDMFLVLAIIDGKTNKQGPIEGKFLVCVV